MNLLRILVASLALSIFSAGAALAQCGTTAPANKFCGNDTGSSALATWKSIPPGALSPIAGGTVLGNRGTSAAVPTPLTNPVLGIPGTSTGEVGLAGATSGTATLRAQAAAGSAVSLMPTLGGTLVGSATAPLAINSTTGLISITGAAGAVLAGAGATFTVSPVLGVPGSSQGSLGFAGATSGTVTVQAQVTAGTATITLPNASGTVAVNATSPLVLSATTGTLTCPTCVTSSGGGAITGTAPISVSAAGVVSINAPYTTLTASNGGIVYSGATNLAILGGTATARQMLQSGSSAAPAWSTATWPATTAAGTLLVSASANTVTATSTPVLGVAGSLVGSIGFQNLTSGTVTLQPVTGALGTVTINIPAAAGTMAVSATAPITLSAAGAIGITGAALTKTDDTNVTLTLGGSPTGALVAATSLTLGWTGQLAVSRGGTGIGSGNSGGVPYFNSGTTMASSAVLAANQLVLGGGAGAAPATLGSLGTTTQILHGNAAGAPTWGSLVYADIASGSIATCAQYFAATASTLAAAANVFCAETSLGSSGSGTFSFDFSTFINASVTMTGNVTTQTLTNVSAGKAGTIAFVQDGTGSRTTVWNSIFKFAGGVTPALSTAAGAIDILSYSCRSATNCVASLLKDVR